MFWRGKNGGEEGGGAAFYVERRLTGTEEPGRVNSHANERTFQVGTQIPRLTTFTLTTTWVFFRCSCINLLSTSIVQRLGVSTVGRP